MPQVPPDYLSRGPFIPSVASRPSPLYLSGDSWWFWGIGDDAPHLIPLPPQPSCWPWVRRASTAAASTRNVMRWPITCGAASTEGAGGDPRDPPGDPWTPRDQQEPPGTSRTPSPTPLSYIYNTNLLSQILFFPALRELSAKTLPLPQLAERSQHCTQHMGLVPKRRITHWLQRRRLPSLFPRTA